TIEVRLMKWRRGSFVGTIAAMTLIAPAGCSWTGDDGSTPPPVGLPQSWIWTTAPAVSLDSQNARTVRGWIESSAVYQNAEVSYPGFVNATSPELLERLRPSSTGMQLGGTSRHFIRSISATGNELRASLCSDGWDEFVFAPDGSPFGAADELVLHTLEMRKAGPTTNTSSSGSQQALIADDSPTPTNVGRTPYDSWLKGPKDNVFNNWIATKWDVSVDPPSDCIAWFKRNHPGLRFPTGYKVETRPNRPTAPPPPTLPNSPGW
ncbi:MAG TPA: hypothetical protein VFH20_05700, partial [Propionibacteriaceae bacterium]|nr:hypothetical protein [Propionibacteriaceae bacterium]